MRNNAEQQRDVLDELLWDPSINVANVQVAADRGTVTLSGAIASFSEKSAAERDARKVRGVVCVVDNLEVRLPTGHERTDADLAGKASDALRWNSLVPSERISVSAAKGRLTLIGEVAHHYQREAAENAVRFLIGVKSVNNRITIEPSVMPVEVKSLIEKALVRNAETDARKIQVDADGGIVTLSGNVHSWFEREEATRAACSAPGVYEVLNHLAVVAETE